MVDTTPTSCQQPFFSISSQIPLSFLFISLIYFNLLGTSAQFLVADQVFQFFVSLVFVGHGLDVRVLRDRAAVHAAEVSLVHL